MIRSNPNYDNYRYALELPPHIQDIYKKSNNAFHHPAIQQLLRSNYTEFFMSGGTYSDIEWLYGGVEFRKEEDPYDYCSYSDIVNEYVALNIKTTFGLTINEYLELTIEEKEILVKQASKVNKEIADQLAKQNKEQEQIGKMTSKASGDSGKNIGISMAHMEDMFGLS